MSKQRDNIKKKYPPRESENDGKRSSKLKPLAKQKYKQNAYSDEDDYNDEDYYKEEE